MFGRIKAFLKRMAERTATEGAIVRSITGEPIATLTFGFGGSYSLKQTELGIKGSTVSWAISQVGDNRLVSIALLKGEYDDCLSLTAKNHLIEHIRDRVEREGGYYFESQRNQHGFLDFEKVYWDNATLATVEQLLEEMHNEIK